MSIERYIKSRRTPLCELHTHFPQNGFDYFAPFSPTNNLRIPRNTWAKQTHHICGSGNGAVRIDAAPNLIRVCLTAHDWVEQFKLPGFVLCCWVKKLRNELDWSVLTEIKNRPLPDWLDTDEFEKQCREIDSWLGFGWLESKRQELIG